MNLQHSDNEIQRLERKGKRLYRIGITGCIAGIIVTGALLTCSIITPHKKTEAGDFGSIINSNAKLKSMSYKATPFAAPAQHLIAGLTTKKNHIEFFSCEHYTLKFFQGGIQYDFKDTPIDVYANMVKEYRSDAPAVKDLEYYKDDDGTLHKRSLKRQVEIYNWYMRGGLDGTPDVIDGKLQPCENFRESKNCRSLKWDNKHITINEKPLTPREIKMLDSFLEIDKDEVTSNELSITVSTLSTHKKNLFNKVGVQSKGELMVLALRQQAAFTPRAV